MTALFGRYLTGTFKGSRCHMSSEKENLRSNFFVINAPAEIKLSAESIQWAALTGVTIGGVVVGVVSGIILRFKKKKDGVVLHQIKEELTDTKNGHLRGAIHRIEKDTGERLNLIDTRIDNLSTRFNQLDARFNTVDERMQKNFDRLLEAMHKLCPGCGADRNQGV
jgi:hypothetical protein